MSPNHWLTILLILCFGLAARAQKIDYRLVGTAKIEERLHAVDKDNNKRRRKIIELFKEAGCGENQLSEEPRNASWGNVVCTLPGSESSTIVVGAHFDHVPAGLGVIDNWTGASMLPSLLESLSSKPRKHTFVFIAFAEEEKGLVGSRHYVGHASSEELQRIHAMIAMDSLGLGITEVWVSRSDLGLMKKLDAVADMLKVPVRGMNVEKIGTTDSEPFSKKKIPTITFHSVTQETLNVLHTADDDFPVLKPAQYYQSYALLAAYLAYLDVTLE